MLEGKFKELVSLFLDGEINDAELTWLTDEIRAHEKHRESFRSEIQIHIATCESMRSDRGLAKLRSLHELDLEAITAQTLRLYVPRKDRGSLAGLKNPSETAWKVEQESEALPGKPSVVSPWRESPPLSKRKKAEAVVDEGDKGFFWLPTFGVLMIVGAIFAVYWVNTHPEGSSRKGSVVTDEQTASQMPDFRVLYQVAGFSREELGDVVDSTVEEQDAPEGLPLFLSVDADALRPTGSDEIRLTEGQGRRNFRFLNDSYFQFASSVGP